MQYKSKNGIKFKWLHVFYNVLRASVFLLGKSRTENLGTWAASLTHAGYAGHSMYSQDPFVTNTECAGSAVWMPWPLSAWAGCFWCPTVYAGCMRARATAVFLGLPRKGSSLQLLPGTAFLCLETSRGWIPAASVSEDYCLNSLDTRGASFLRVISKCP